MEESTVMISMAEYKKLKEAQDKLECLQALGVDNWQGYDDAMQYYYENYVKHEVE